MKKYIFIFIIIFLSMKVQSQTYLFGKTVNENQIPLSGTEIINITTEQKSLTDSDGNFMIRGSVGDQIRFVRLNYEREILYLSTDSFTTSLVINMKYSAQEIEEVTIAYKPTGDLKEDLKHLPKNEKTERLRRDIAQSLRYKQTEVIPRLSTPSAFAPPNYSAGTVSVGGVASALSQLLGNKPKPTKATYAETKDFLEKLKANIDLKFYKQYGITDEQLDQFLADANADLKLADKFRQDFSIIAIESLLREKFLTYKFQ